MSDYKSREVRLKNRPVGMPTENDFELAEVTVPDIVRGEMLVRNIFMSVDPYMRGRMYDRKSYVPPFQLDHALEGGCVGRVIESNHGRFKAGEYVLDMMGWREYYVSDGTGMTLIDQKIAPLSAFLGCVGMPGLTAYVGLIDIGKPKAGETVFVSAASGAVGSIVCQIAKLKGCYVVGSAGSDEKVSWLLAEAGINAAFNYKKIDNLMAEVGKR